MGNEKHLLAVGDTRWGRGSQFGWFFTLVRADAGGLCIWEKEDMAEWFGVEECRALMRETNCGTRHDLLRGVVVEKSYEVVFMQWRDEMRSKIAGIDIVFKAGWLYPSDAQFGITAWTLHTRKAADSMFSNLLNPLSPNNTPALPQRIANLAPEYPK